MITSMEERIAIMETKFNKITSILKWMVEEIKSLKQRVKKYGEIFYTAEMQLNFKRCRKISYADHIRVTQTTENGSASCRQIAKQLCMAETTLCRYLKLTSEKVAEPENSYKQKLSNGD